MTRSRRPRKRKQRQTPKPQTPQQMGDQPGRKTVGIFVRDARYYAEERSIIIVGEEVQTRRPITQQGLVKDFIEAFGLSVAEDDHEAWRFFASQLIKRKDPLNLVFLNCKTEEHEI